MLLLNKYFDNYFNPGSIPSLAQTITYTAFNKVSTISEETYDMAFTYGHDRLRRKTQLYENSTLKQTKLFLGNYEKVIDETTGEEKEYHYLSAPTGLFAVVTKTDGGSETLNYVLTDHLGSIQTITDDEGESVSRHSYGAWGRLRNATNWGYSNPCSLPFFGRGYTGHEHLEEFGLVNMNGRLYDPVLGRMLSPDNFVQMPENSQNFNRYSYSLNNPLIYTDPSGEFLLTGLTFGLESLKLLVKFSQAYIKSFDSPAQGEKIFAKALRDFDPTAPWSKTNKAFKIDMGLFKTDPNKSFGGRALELVSRFTWQAPQTGLGYLSSHGYNLAGNVRSVGYYGGTTVVETYSSGWGGFTLGNYIIGERGIKADPYNTLFQHEYGHYIQSQLFGPFYIPKYGIPSILSDNNKEHSLHPVEQDANVRAFMYFNKHIEGYSGWNDFAHPIKGYVWRLPFDHPINQHRLGKRKLRPAWFDFIMMPSAIIPMPLHGYINSLILNNKFVEL